ncbi:MAG: acetyl-CoA hydrolase/transferase family protein [Ekhidna sp.]|nr:acetyl-CoA hydrolase/transferase family protein [Ekhidna sp.]
MNITTIEDALSLINDGDNVFIHSAAMTPSTLVDGLKNLDVKNVNLIHIHTESGAEYLNEDKFTTYSCFVGGNIRKLINSSNKANYIPVFLSEIYQLLEQGERKVDVALLKVSPPDQHGYCSLGVSVDVSLAAIRAAKHIIVEINEQVPRVHGDGFIHISQIDKAIESTTEMYSPAPRTLSEEEMQIGKYIAELIDDGSTLQMGIGGIPDAVLSQLGNHKDLGIHTEMFSDGILPLVENGVITGRHKKVLPGKLASCFALGSRKLYDFLDDNPIVEFKEASFTNDTALIRKNPKVVAINSAIEVDLTGQVCADSIGTYQYSGVGGQMDFIRGAALSPGGKPIIAMTSSTKKGLSKINPLLKSGASVTTTRAHVRWVVTEYGAVNLFGKDLLERARLLISIAHPDHREDLEKAMKERYVS